MIAFFTSVQSKVKCTFSQLYYFSLALFLQMCLPLWHYTTYSSISLRTYIASMDLPMLFAFRRLECLVLPNLDNKKNTTMLIYALCLQLQVVRYICTKVLIFTLCVKTLFIWPHVDLSKDCIIEVASSSVRLLSTTFKLRTKANINFKCSI